MRAKVGEFSFRSRKASLDRFRNEVFDLLIIGGGITGASVARDAASRGLRVALVEKSDFACGTSSRSSKLIHGGLRYLENYEFRLVFESVAERALLLKLVPHMVKPLPFYFPVYAGAKNGKTMLSMGMWLYDLFSAFRTPEVHKSLSPQQVLEVMPFVRKEGLLGAFRYFDASMWDDVLTVETLRSAQDRGAAVVNYVQAVSPIWKDERIVGFRVRDRAGEGDATSEVHARKVVICAGPWTDIIGRGLSPNWSDWLAPSRGIHLVFDLKKVPVPGAFVMNSRNDGRIAFAIPRPDFGTGVTIVGTTDGPSERDPEKTPIMAEDIRYLMDLLHQHFPSMQLSTSDILSAYIGIRPLVAPGAGQASKGAAGSSRLQKVSREHHIGKGPGGTIIVAGGKYTTHRSMAEEIVDFTLKSWRNEARTGKIPPLSDGITRPNTKTPLNLKGTFEALDECKARAAKLGVKVAEELYSRYGGEALDIMEIECSTPGLPRIKDPEGFPCLASQLRHAVRSGMVLHLEDFYFRRTALFLARADHGKPWAEHLGRVWAEEMNFGQDAADAEIRRLLAEIERRETWRTALSV